MNDRTTTVLQRRTVYSGRVFTVTQDRLRLPHGGEATMDTVRHAASVVLVPMPAPGRIVLVRQFRSSIDRWIWELPAGTVDGAESHEAAARRECHEEIGQVPGRVERIGHFHPTPGYCDEVMVFFRLTDLATPEARPALDADEVLEPHTLTLTDAVAMLDRGEITDMKTALGLHIVRATAAAG